MTITLGAVHKVHVRRTQGLLVIESVIGLTCSFVTGNRGAKTMVAVTHVACDMGREENSYYEN